jgi:3-phenylpropionate/trans-cinnamate dioxygenase ferredoxin reductase component
MDEQMLIVGGGLAGAMAAQTLREEGFSGSVTLVCAEHDRPYERPPLSKGYLMAGQDRESVFVHPATWYAEQGVTLLTGARATAVDAAAHKVVTTDGTTLPYTKLLLATGSSPRRLPLPGAELDGVLYLRSLADADQLAPRLVEGANVVVIGGGWIGLEVAAAARTAKANVTVVETAALPLQRVLGREVAQIFVDLHEANGVRVLTRRSVQAMLGRGRVESVALGDGEVLTADLVVVGIGVWPDIELAESAAIEVREGVRTDASLRTSDPDIFAAGDIAEFDHPMLGRPLRVEHWAHARASGATAARAMLGQAVVYDEIPFFYTDQYDLGMEYRGHIEPGEYDRVVFRGSTELVGGTTPSFFAFWTRDDRILAAMNVNSWDNGDDLERLVRAGHAGARTDLGRLADPAAPLVA